MTGVGRKIAAAVYPDLLNLYRGAFRNFAAWQRRNPGAWLGKPGPLVLARHWLGGWVWNQHTESIEMDEANRMTRMCMWSGVTKKNVEVRNRLAGNAKKPAIAVCMAGF